MIPIFNLKGYTKPDPLDRLSTRQGVLLHMAVIFVFTVLLIYLIDDVFRLVFFKSFGWKIVELVLFTGIYAPLFYFLRKSSSLLSYLIILLPLFLVDIYLEAYCVRTIADPAIWNYYPNTFVTAIQPSALQFFLTISLDAVLFGPICLWISRLIASVLKKGKKENDFAAHQTLFTEDRIEDALSIVPQRVVDGYEYKWSFKNLWKVIKERWRKFFQHDPDFWVLRILGLGYLLYLFVLSLGALGIEPMNPKAWPIWPEFIRSLLSDTYSNPVHGVHTFAKISMMVLLTFVAAFNPRIRWFPVLALLVGHVISTIVSFVFYFYGAGESFTLTSGIVDGIMVLIFLILLFRAHHAIGEEFYLIKGFPRSFSLAGLGQNILFYGLTIFGGTYLVFVLLSKYLGETVAFFAQFKPLYDLPEAMLVNTIAFLSTFTLIAYICAKNRKLRRLMTQNISDPLRISVIVAFIWFVGKNIRGEVFASPGTNTYLLVYVLLGSLILLLIRVLNNLVYNVDYLITSLHPSEAAAAGAAAETFYGLQHVDTYEAIKKMDNYVANIRGRKRGLINFPFYILENIFSPLLALRPRFSTMSVEERLLFFKKYLLRTPAEVKGAAVPVLANIALNIGLSIRSLCSLAHLTTQKGQEQVGYIPPDLRDRLQLLQIKQQAPYGNVVKPPNSPKAPNNFHPEEKIEAKSIPSIAVQSNHNSYKIRQAYDYVIIGSGAAGAVMAYRLASTQGVDPKKILLVERGLRNSHRNDMSDDELEMLARLYKEGGLQQTKRFDMILLQGEALGGTTVINNAVCFKMTEDSKKQWEKDYDIDLSDLHQHYQQVKEEINIHPVDELAINKKVRATFRKGVEEYNKKYPPGLKKVDPVLVNARNEVGDGLWNLGNKRGRKLSMAETYIPWAEGLGIHVSTNTNALRFYTDAAAKDWNKKTADKVLLQIGKSTFKEIQINKALIVAGGCLASSHFLMRSEVKGNVGKNLACNYAFPFAFEYKEELKAYDGTQINMAAIEEELGLVFETYFNPPGAFALTLPFHFKTHLEVMENYSRYLNLGILIGSDNSGTISSNPDPLSGRAFSFDLNQQEMEKIKVGFLKLLEVARLSGAISAILPLKPGIRVDLEDTTAYHAFVKAFTAHPLLQNEIVLNSAHPQGGNLMAGDASKHKADRVVNAQFKLEDHTNVYVVDGSVFPRSLGINPQWTIMALSSMAAKHIDKAHG